MCFHIASAVAVTLCHWWALFLVQSCVMELGKLMDTLPLDSILDLTGPVIWDRRLGILLGQGCAGCNRAKIRLEDHLDMAEHETVDRMTGEELPAHRLAGPPTACTAHPGVLVVGVPVDSLRSARPIRQKRRTSWLASIELGFCYDGRLEDEMSNLPSGREIRK